MLARVVLAFAAVTLATAAGPVGPAGLPTLRSARAGVPFQRNHLRSSKGNDDDTYDDPDIVTGGHGQGQDHDQQKFMTCQALRAMTLRGGAIVPEEVVQSGPKVFLLNTEPLNPSRTWRASGTTIHTPSTLHPPPSTSTTQFSTIDPHPHPQR